MHTAKLVSSTALAFACALVGYTPNYAWKNTFDLQQKFNERSHPLTEPALEKEEDTSPNLLFIFPDQLRNASIGISGQDPVYTPNIDQLAKEGLRFTNAISNYPLCSPARAMLMTGKLPYHNSVLSNSNSSRYAYGNSWQKADTSFSDILNAKNYNTAYIGKLHLTSPAPVAGSDSIVWDAYTPTDQRHGFQFWYSYGTYDEHFTPHYWVNDAPQHKLKKITQWSAEHEADVIIKYLQNKGGKQRDSKKPFALFWSLNPPHPPYQYVPAKYVERYKNIPDKELLNRPNVNGLDNESLAYIPAATRQGSKASEAVRNYFGMVTGIDDQIGRVLRILEQQGLSKNTIVVLSSDHGEMMGSHGLMSKNVWYDESINIPFIIRWPQKIKPGATDLLLGLPDVMPTLLGAMGHANALPEHLDGQNYSSWLLTGTGAQPQEALYYFIQASQPASGNRGIRTKTHTYVITFDKNLKERTFMYNNVSDPMQLNNIAGTGAFPESELRKQLLSSLEQKKDPWLKQHEALLK